MEVGQREACQGVRIPSMRRGPFCQKCFLGPRPAPGPSTPWIPHDGALCRHPDSVLRAPLFSCRQPPIPVHDSRLQESTRQAHETRSGGQVVIARARLPSRAAARQNSRFLIHPIPAYGHYRRSRRSLTNGRSCFIARSGDIRERSAVSQIPVPARCSKAPASVPFFGGVAPDDGSCQETDRRSPRTRFWCFFNFTTRKIP